MKVGDIVNLLDPHGHKYSNSMVVNPRGIGIVTGFDKKRGRVHVYWAGEGEANWNTPGASWEWGRLKVLTNE